MKIKKSLMFGMLLAMCLPFCAVIFSGCGGPGKLSTKDAFSDIKDAYAFATISSSNFLEISNMGGASTMAAEVNQGELADKIGQYLNIVNGMIGNKQLPKSTDVTSDRAGYKCSETKVTGIDGTEYVYKMYYKEKVMSETEEREPNDDEDYEVNTELEGFLVYETNEYTFTGTKEVEKDEAEIKFTVNGKDNKKVTVEQETEVEELEYKYSFFDGNTKQKEIEIELESNDGKIEFEIGVDTNGTKEYFKIEQKRPSGSVYYEIEATGGVRMTAKIVDQEGTKKFEVELSDGTKKYYDVVA